MNEVVLFEGSIDHNYMLSQSVVQIQAVYINPVNVRDGTT